MPNTHRFQMRIFMVYINSTVDKEVVMWGIMHLLLFLLLDQGINMGVGT
jgi:hypothetical protein